MSKPITLPFVARLEPAFTGCYQHAPDGHASVSRFLNRILMLGMATLIVGLSQPSVQAAGLLIADGGFGGVLQTQQHSVNVTVNNGVAVTHVEQVFLNTEDRIVEALYTFPVPKDASVANFSMWINGKEMIGEVVEKKRAREIYESYKQTRKDPGLLEQVDFKRFEMRIFPIAANAEQRVKITYYQQMEFDHDWANYVYPLATTTRVKSDSSSQAFSFRFDVKSDVPISKMESPSHPKTMAISRFDDQLFRASLESASASLDADVVVAFQVKRPVTGLDVIASKSPGDDGFFQATLTIGDELAKAEKGMDYVFVLDISGSMRNRGKLNLSQESVYRFIENLSPEDRFEIVAFNDLPQPFFGEMTAAKADIHQRARDFLTTRQARGGTSLQPAIQTAYRFADTDRQLNVVVLSDGLTDAGEQNDLVATIRSRPENCRVFAIGVGNDVNRPLLRSMAERAGGLASFLSHGDNFERQAAAFRRKLTRPAIEEVRLQFDGTVYDVEPKERANIYHGSPLRFYGRYRRGETISATLTGTLLGAPFEKTVGFELPEVEPSNPEIERMWAWHRVQRLLPLAKTNDSVAKNELITLCEQFSIVSEFASFIVLENDSEYQRWNIERRNLARSSRDRASQQRVNEQLQRLREQALAELGPATSTKEPEKPNFETVAASPTNRTASSAQDRMTNSPSSTSLPRSTSSSGPRRRVDLDFGAARNSNGGGGGGGGAFDPLTGLLALGCGGMAWAQRRKNKAS